MLPRTILSSIEGINNHQIKFYNADDLSMHTIRINSMLGVVSVIRCEVRRCNTFDRNPLLHYATYHLRPTHDSYELYRNFIVPAPANKKQVQNNMRLFRHHSRIKRGLVVESMEEEQLSPKAKRRREDEDDDDDLFNDAFVWNPNESFGFDDDDVGGGAAAGMAA